jgi:hypothetical protein
LDAGLFALNFARQASNAFLNGIEEQHFHRPFSPEGGTPAYIVGHLTSTDNMTLQMLAGRPSMLTEREQQLFGGGASPESQRGEYPSPSAMLQKMHEVRNALIGYFQGLSDAELNAPVEGPMAQFGDTRAKLMASLAWHEGMHAGQLTVIRRQLGLPRVFG